MRFWVSLWRFVYSSLGEDVRAPLAIFTAIWENPKTSLIMSCNKTAKTPSTPWRAFLYNSSVGVGGLFDVAKDIDWKSEKPILVKHCAPTA